MIQTLAASPKRRRRRAAMPWRQLPILPVAAHELLRRWARGDAPQRRWSTLQTLAGAGAIEAAEALLAQLLECGCVQVDERFDAGRWWPHQVTWIDLPRVQGALGLTSSAERDAAQNVVGHVLADLAERVPILRDVAMALLRARLSSAVREARTELLQALASWIVEQRSGVRQDFALHARPHTKAVTDAEWRWLESGLALAALGIERFAQLLWLAGPMALASDRGHASLQPWPFIGIPIETLEATTRVGEPPALYWVIENRASFERQARVREFDHCVIWVPGRPPSAWLAAIARLLELAPAPARISADTDPAGIEIALAAASAWVARGLQWAPHAMEPGRLTSAKTMPINDYDRASIQRVLSREGVPIELRELAVEIERLGRKAEQEGWL
jgi:hypothetical protein